MNSKEKAIELVEKFQIHTMADSKQEEDQFEYSKQCALIAAHEVLNNTSTPEDHIYWYRVIQLIDEL